MAVVWVGMGVMEAQTLLSATCNTTRPRHIPASCLLQSSIWVSFWLNLAHSRLAKEHEKWSFQGIFLLLWSRTGGPRGACPPPQHLLMSSRNSDSQAYSYGIWMSRTVSNVPSLCRIWGLAPLDWKSIGGKDSLSLFLPQCVSHCSFCGISHTW